MKTVKVRIEQLRPHPAQDRLFPQGSRYDADLRELANDIRRNGQRTPIEITTNRVILCGHRRVAAARLLGWTEVDCVVRDDLDAQGAAQRHIEDNLHRRHLDRLGWARAYRELQKLPAYAGQGDLRDAIGKRFGISGRQLSRIVRVLDAPLAVQVAYSDGKLPLALALRTLELSQARRNELARELEGNQFPASVVRSYTRRSYRMKSTDLVLRHLARALQDFIAHVQISDIDPLQGARLAPQLHLFKRARFRLRKLIEQIEADLHSRN